METREALLARINDHLGSEAAAFAAQYARPAVGIVLDPVAQTASRFGGTPDLADGEEWPVFGISGAFLGQIDFAEIPEEIRELLPMPEAGVLRLFTPNPEDEEDYFWGDPGYVRALFTQDELASSEWPEDLEDGDRTDSIPIRFEACWDLPFDQYQASSWPFEDSAAYDDLRRSLHPVEHLFGYPEHASLGYDPTPEGAIALLTVGSVEELDWMWHDGDNLQIFITPEQLAAGDFSALASDAG